MFSLWRRMAALLRQESRSSEQHSGNTMEVEQNQPELYRVTQKHYGVGSARTKVIVDADESFGDVIEAARGNDWANGVDVISVRGTGTIRATESGDIIVSDYVED
jgi:hypothetical protein